MNGVQIRLGDLLQAIEKRWGMVLGLTLLGFVAGLVMLFVPYFRGTTMDYEVNCSFAVTSQSKSGSYLNGSDYMSSQDFYLAQDMVDSVSYVVKSDALLSDALQSAGIAGVDVDTIRSNLTLQQYNETQIIEMELKWYDDKDALKLVKAILSEAEKLLPKTLQVGQVAIINEPKVSYRVGGTLQSFLWLIMALAGAVIGVAVAALDLILRPTLLSLNDVDEVFGLETLGVVPDNPGLFKKSRRISVRITDKTSDIEQNYASAAYIIQNLLVNEKCRSLYVTSTVDNEGKTVTAANIAVQLAAMEHTVLLVDLDTRNPSLGGLFLDKVDYAASLNALYRGDAVRGEAIHKLTGYLSLLPMVLEKYALLMDSSVLNLVEEIGRDYEYLIIDAPAVGLSSTPLLLNRITDGAIFVVRHDMAIMQDIVSAIDKLRKAGTDIFGCIVTRAEPQSSTVRRRKEQRRSDEGRIIPAMAAMQRGEKKKEEAEKKDEAVKKAESVKKEETVKETDTGVKADGLRENGGKTPDVMAPMPYEDEQPAPGRNRRKEKNRNGK